MIKGSRIIESFLWKMSGLFNFFILLLFLSTSLRDIRSAAQLLPDDEVETMRVIASKLQNTRWNVSRDSCTTGEGLQQIISNDTRSERRHIMEVGSNITCNCNITNSTFCHITNIQVKKMNLNGVLPEEFANLTFLQEIDLTRNYIGGSIPASFSQLPLIFLSIGGNRISGSIPEQLANISTLEELVVENNLLGGPLPPQLGRLSRLRRFVASANNFTGTIPVSYGNLTNLEQFRIDGSTLSGSIPDFIGNWKNLTVLDMQGTNMSGPIPTTISLLRKLKSLRISDLAGSSSSPFPNLEAMTNMEDLILRNCLLTGPMPKYIDGGYDDLKNIDLSFNQLNGSIPELFQFIDFDTLFLNNNSLSEDIPAWMFSRTDKIDLSYNNFANTTQQTCGSSRVNLVSALSPSAPAPNRESWCLRDEIGCSRSPKYHSLFINCGGDSTVFEGNEYQRDFSNEQAYFYSESDGWAYSANGVFMGNSSAPFVGTNTNVRDGKIYESARFSPTSLRYYGLCLREGSYKVRLHFAEISYTNDSTFASLGRRYFDISIQGVLERKDFSIVERAGGVGRGTFIDFDNVTVTGSTLEIHLYWAGKGTTGIPERGVYGPLLSAIAITPNYNVSTGGISAGAIAGIVIGSCAFIVLILALLWWGGYIGGDKEDKELRALELQTGLARALFGKENQKLNLDWSTRKKICMGIAKGLAYLHEESRLKIVHRDIKATNVLLDKDLNAKISDFGLAKLDEEEDTHISTRIAGTIGYMAPEYAMRGYLTDKADVYSFGVVLLEIVSGKSNTNYRPKEEFVYLLDWAYVLQEQGGLLDLVDPGLVKYSKDEALMMLNLAILCTNISPTLRPPMSSVVKMLDGKLPLLPPVVKRGVGNPDIKFKAFDMMSHDSQTQVSTISADSQGPSLWNDTSLYKDETQGTSSETKLLPDLYDVDI
ncbi:unnamed protein product [Lactuca virosa]|uniref:non-specific serine/threonine protein kinase n=1 Tax=Lactuca virosa TaxID=75947 RepID=A0AAU9MW17_9ASTR|nr:unnamed protein product [Lactuca virosa]